jgi:ABC-type antimicrobial peptide transport system permease subunit
MIHNYFKIAWRNIIKGRTYSFINIGGLAVGMAAAILIALWIHDELSFDKSLRNYNRIAHVMRHSMWNGEKQTGGQSSPIPLNTELHSAFGSNFTHIVMSTWTLKYIMSVDDKKFTQAGRFMQPEAPDMFTLNMLKGSRSGLREMNSIFLSASLAKKLFGNTDPINKTVVIDTKINAKVTGIYEDFRNNSTFNDVTYIAPFDLFVSFNPWAQKVQDNWRDNSFPVYVQIAPHTTFAQVSARIKNVMLSHLDKESVAGKPEVFLHPMSRWHLYSQFENGVNVMSDQLKFIWLYGIIGAVVLILACINFMNLSTARSEKRAKEIGIRKTVGSVRGQLISQFLGESLLLAVFAFVLSLGLVQLILPWFNKVAGKESVILWASPGFWMASIAFILFTALLAGSYPALYLSSLRPVNVLKGLFKAGRSPVIFRKILVVFQFTISVVLVIGIIVVYKQIQFAKDRPVGYQRSGLLVLPKPSGLQGKSEVLRSELLQTGAVNEVAESSSRVTEVGSNDTGFEWSGKDSAMNKDLGSLRVSYEYGKAIGWQFMAGRDFSREFSGDSSGFVINEAAARLMGFTNPVGQTVRCKFIRNGADYKILGVVRNMVMESPFDPVRPTVYFLGRSRWIFVKVNPRFSMADALPKIEAAYKRIVPDLPFDYKFVDEEYAAKFSAEERIGNLSVFFGILAIFISCMGLFGLASFIAEKRTKEIGIRKILGASVFSLWGLLSKEFTLLVMISVLIASPVAYYCMHNWLEGYQYRTELSWWIFTLAISGALLITLLTVSFQAIRAAVANPVKSLRTE